MGQVSIIIVLCKLLSVDFEKLYATLGAAWFEKQRPSKIHAKREAQTPVIFGNRKEFTESLSVKHFQLYIDKITAILIKTMVGRQLVL